jgi:23S rRNA (cytosine1962-C5)-methyltransferase
VAGFFIDIRWRFFVPKNQSNSYELLDFGAGRKLERFGQFILDRCSPAADNDERNHKVDWSTAHVRLDDRGKLRSGELPDSPWKVQVSGIQFCLNITPFGHVGIFPEQHSNWSWLQSLAREQPTPPQALNLFAYTGGSTLALAKAGFHVVHVDASAPSVRWARENASTNQLHEHPIRWIVEDARKFTARERKRGRIYDIIVLDPPSFGHGPGGKRWEIESDLLPLLETCMSLVSKRDGAILLTGHSLTPSLPELEAFFHDHFGGAGKIHAQRLSLYDLARRPLDCGYSLRWQSNR